MRLPGYVAEETVIFSNSGESLQLKQTSFSRESFVPGVLKAIQGVNQLTGIQLGLEHVL
ncbi:dihydrodipicolinate reductase C-terminal domain-containing protein [Weissella diestrammenae]|uniref:dihydrodipicolinate reductase C-terminal domain-containing protein n=1 Tax=Weissella diestrammenae TaxID=1162633 RepID=UPI0030B845EC